MSADLGQLAAELGVQLERKRVKNINFRVRGGVIFMSIPLHCSAEQAAAALLARREWLAQTAARQRALVAQTAAAAAAAEREQKFSLWGEQIAAEQAAAAALSAREQAAQMLASRGAAQFGQAVLEHKNPLDFAAFLAESAGKSSGEKTGKSSEQTALKNYKLYLYQNELEAVVWAFARFWAAELGAEFKAFKHSRARRIWGSCHKARAEGKFAAQLATQSLAAADYVALHEAAHLLQANHSARFWALVAARMSNFRAIASSLRAPADFDL